MQWLKLAAAVVAMMWGSVIMAQDRIGHWRGTLEITSQNSLRINVHFEAGKDGALQGTMDSVDQGAMGIPLAKIAMDGDTLEFTVPAIAGNYAAEWNEAEGYWAGTWSQNGTALPLVLEPGAFEAASPPRPRPARWTVPDDAAIAELIDNRIAGREGAGMVVGVIGRDERRIVARGPADGPAFDGDTVFEIGSMSKAFTALLLADMALDGTVALDDPVEKYLPEGATMPSRNGKQITLKNLSMQDSGLPRLPDNMPNGDPEDPYADYSEQHLLDFLAGHELLRDPGERYEYSNFGVGLLGYVLARAAGTDYEALLEQRILVPLGMNDTSIALPPDEAKRFAQGHDNNMRPAAPWHIPLLAGAGGIRSTADDMLRFLAAALDPDSPIGPAMGLSLAERVQGPGYKAGLGWMIIGPPAGEVLMHGGSTAGFRSHMALQHVTGRAIVVLTNSATEPAPQDIALHVLFGARLSEAPTVPEAPPPAPEREE